MKFSFVKKDEDNLQYSITIDSVEGLIALGEKMRGAFVFRGHASASWKFQTSIERAAIRWGVKFEDLAEREQMVIREFQRRAHHYIKDPPAYDNNLEWMAILQHYGGPTRLLDVTESFLIAIFFAIENADDESVVWAFNGGLFDSEICADINLFEEEKKTGIVLAEPFRLNKRLTIQKGKFLLPLDISSSFRSQLYKKLGTTLDLFQEINTADELNKIIFARVVKIILPKNSHSEIMRFLSNSNITATTLFDGLEGFARSLNIIMRIYD